MSVASEFPPEVYIPDRARRGQPRVRHLALVGPVGSIAAPVRRNAGAPSRLCVEEVAATQAPIRLTRRGKALAVAATLLIGVMLLMAAHLSQGQAPHSSPSTDVAATGLVVVEQGDTLWSIAHRVDPKADPRQVVDELRRANHLSSLDLSPGQTLKVG